MYPLTIILLTLLVLTPSLSHSASYKCRDDKGGLHFSDSPSGLPKSCQKKIGLIDKNDSFLPYTTNRPPVANAGPNQQVNVGDVVHLDGSASRAAENDSLTYYWYFDSKPDESRATIFRRVQRKTTFIADKEGTYVLKLYVDDNHMQSSASYVTIKASLERHNLFKPVVYSKHGNSTLEPGIWTIDPDSQEKSRLLHWGLSPTYSSDGSKIAFYKYPLDGIYIIDKNLKPFQVTASGSMPTWSPDGSKIAYVDVTCKESNLKCQFIWIVNADGTSAHQLSTVNGSHPSWSPDGRKIAFHDPTFSGIWTINPDGSEEELLVKTGIQPDWSPDGKQLCYTRFPYIWTMDADGKNQEQLSSHKGLSCNWSPEGKQIIYLNHDRKKASDLNYLYTITKYRTDERRLVSDKSVGSADWGLLPKSE